jgi:hypothetical protein
VFECRNTKCSDGGLHEFASIAILCELRGAPPRREIDLLENHEARIRKVEERLEALERRALGRH